MIRLTTIALIMLLSCPVLAAAEIIVVTSKKSSIESLSKDQVRRIYLGKLRAVKGKYVRAVELSEERVREKFYKEITGKSLSQLRSYWAIRLFSGKSQPPISKESNSAVLQALKKKTGTIGFVEAKALNSEDYKILFRLK